MNLLFRRSSSILTELSCGCIIKLPYRFCVLKLSNIILGVLGVSNLKIYEDLDFLINTFSLIFFLNHFHFILHQYLDFGNKYP